MKQRPEYDPKIIGMNLRRLREKKHLTVEQVRVSLSRLCTSHLQVRNRRRLSAGRHDARPHGTL